MLDEESKTIVANEKFLNKCCDTYGSGIGKDECKSIVMSGFSDAMRSYSPGRTDFHIFAEEVITEYIRDYKKDRNSVMKIESKFRLNKYPGNEYNNLPIAKFKLVTGDTSEYVILNDFLGSLDEISGKIARLIIDKYTTAEICEKLNLPVSIIGFLIQEIGRDMLDYYEYETI